MADTLEQRIQALEGREAIRDLRTAYCFLVDDGRYDELVDTCFTQDATCDFRALGPDPGLIPLVFQGREEIRTFMKGLVDALLHDMMHTTHNHRITLDGDTASGSCYFELTAIETATNEPVVASGRYIDKYRRVDGVWHFAQRNAEIRFLGPLSPGWGQQPFVASLLAEA